ncbi:MAG: TlpA disulfide reductase family protein [Pseudomonadota bacterium]
MKLSTKFLLHLFMPAMIIAAFMLVGCSREQKQDAPAIAAVDQPAPDFSLKDIQGKTWNLADLRGKVVFVNFWATWCPPCQEELPSMEGLHRGMPASSFQMLTILNNDRADFAQNLALKRGYTFPILLDPESKVASAYGITGVPETFIIDPQGVLREKHIGPRDWNSQGAWQMLSTYLPRTENKQQTK